MAFNFSLKGKNKDAAALRKEEDDAVHEPDFIPFACHYDHETLLTKNGELLQTIKIVGFNFESVGNETIDLRETIREAIGQGLRSTNFAVWFHTIRRRKSLSPGGKYKEPFPRYLHELWTQHNDWTHKYINEVFITIIHDGETANIKNPARFTRGLFIFRDLQAREDYLREIHESLTQATNHVLEKLQVYGARKLGIYEKEGIYYSEQLHFLGKIIKLREEDVPLEELDISQQLATDQITFGYDTLELRAPDERRRFGAVLTVKEYHELPLLAIDRFLQLPEEFIISQVMSFVPKAIAMKSYGRQQRILDMSGDKKYARTSGLDDIKLGDKGKPTDFAEHQITIFLMADDGKQLNRYVETMLESVSSLGLIVMREEVQLEEAYWSQLPGNFTFLRRMRPIDMGRAAGFANLSNYPAGKLEGNLWGPAITVFNTAANTPYFFNFHNGNVGHTSIIGPYGTGKTVLMNFLLAQSRKLDTKLFVFDYERNSEVFLRALGGKYAEISLNAPQIAMNPFQMEPTPQNVSFLNIWVEALLTTSDPTPLTSAQANAVQSAIDKLLTQPQASRTLPVFAETLYIFNAELVERLNMWHTFGSHSGLFDHVQDEVVLDGLVNGFEMAEIVQDWQAVPAVMLYLMHRVMQQLDGTPSIIVLDEAWNLVDNYYFAPRIHGWLEAVSRRNGLVIFATESIEGAAQSAVSGEVFSNIATQIYLPNSQPTSAYQTVFGLTDNEFELLSLMSLEQRHFMLKKGQESIIGHLNLIEFDKILHVLSSQDMALAHMRDAIAEKGEKPELWLSAFHERMSQKHA